METIQPIGSRTGKNPLSIKGGDRVMKSTAAFRRLLILLVTSALAGPMPIAAQTAFPNKPIRLIVPYAPGGNADPVARMIGQKLNESWGQPVVIDNRPGGNTVIGIGALARSAPDGYTLGTVFATQVILPHLTDALPYDAIKDFAPVATVTMNEQLMVVHPSVPANNLQEFIALAKSKPGALNFSSNASGGVTHLAVELFCLAAGIKMQHVPYKGGGPAMTALVGGEVQMSFSPPLVAMPMIKAGRIKALAISGERRLSALPDVPTFAEAGLQGLDAKVWFGILAPAGTPKYVIDKLSSELAKIMAMPDVKEKLLGLGQEPFVTTPEQFADLLKSDMDKFGRVIKAANIKLD
ncbi:MAG: Bug family tripartite tricarboxylate transporter substrate binding protein [Lautropia sp.]